MTSSEPQAALQAEAIHQAQRWVIDTNIVLDLWLFEDPATVPLRDALDRKSTRLNSSHIPLSRMPSSA